LELDLDFADEGLEVVSHREVAGQLAALGEQLTRLESSFVKGRLIREGVMVVLAGLPNAGKSSLFNALLEEERAIVTHLPGTTRDALEEEISIGGIAFRLVDTAGLREPDNVAEAKGIARSRDAVQSADVILYVVDSSVPHSPGEVPDPIRNRGEGQRVVLALNKSDLERATELPELERILQPFRCVSVSAQTGAGLPDIRKALLESVGEVGEGEEVRLTNLRHVEAVRKARAALSRGIESLEKGVTNEFVSADVRESAMALAEITGEVSSNDVLNGIFSRFCIGK